MRDSRIIFEVTKDGFLTVQRDSYELKRGWFWGILAGILRRIRKGKKKY